MNAQKISFVCAIASCVIPVIAFLAPFAVIQAVGPFTLDSVIYPSTILGLSALPGFLSAFVGLLGSKITSGNRAHGESTCVFAFIGLMLCGVCALYALAFYGIESVGFGP
jgi:hypothetical protein